jgi:hypothetical protein
MRADMGTATCAIVVIAIGALVLLSGLRKRRPRVRITKGEERG